MKPQLSKEGRRLLWTAVGRIERMPDTFEMGDWLFHDHDVKPTGKVPEPYCGTMACIAGHIVLAKEGLERFYDGSVAGRALDYLGISDSEARSEAISNLFLGMKFKRRKITHKNIRARIHHWLKTGV
jgi:hypothetical protein